MRGSVLVTSLALLALPAAARADIAEAPPRTVSGSPPCARPTGAGGELTMTVAGGVRTMRATREGFVRGEDIPLGRTVIGCATVVAKAGGAAVAVARDDRGQVRAAVREPGGTWGAGAPVAESDGWAVRELATAVSERGDAVVAWSEDGSDGDDGSETRIRVARRAPGDRAFGTAQIIGATGPRPWTLLAGVSGSGEAFVLWTTLVNEAAPYRLPVRVAIAPPGAAFGPPAEVGRVPLRSTPALAVGADGRALVAIPDGADLGVSERAPGGAFGPVAQVTHAPDWFGARARAVLGPAGEAVVTWEGRAQGGAGLASRGGPGPFTGVTLAETAALRRRGDPFYSSETYYLGTLSAFTFPGVGVDVRLTGDGRAVLATAVSRPPAACSASAQLVTLTLGGTAVTSEPVGGALRDISDAYALTLPDGVLAVAWTDELVDARVRFHLAIAGPGGEPAAAPPRVRIGRPRSRVVPRDSSLDLPVRCSAPCEVRAQLLDGSYGEGFLHMDRAGEDSLSVSSGLTPLAPLQLGPVRMRITYGPGDGRTTRSRTLTLRLRRPPDRPEPKVLALRAVRRGDHIDVTWRTDRRPGEYGFYATGDDTRGWSGEPLVAAGFEGARGRRFQLTLPLVEGVRWVTLRMNALSHAYQRRYIVRVS
jgi:hypothetical protein